jgi:hypothetical protein
MKTLTLLSILLFSTSSFASVTTRCSGKIGSKGSASVAVTTAEDDNVEGTASIVLFSGNPTAMPLHYQFPVIQTRNFDSDADVSILYRDKSGKSRIKIKINDNPAMGASYLVNVPGLGKLPLSCKGPRI